MEPRPTSTEPDISDADARRLAAEYYDGALLALASTGTINQAVRLEIARDLRRKDWSPQQIVELGALARYVSQRADRGPVEGWENLSWGDLSSLRGGMAGWPSSPEGDPNPSVFVVKALSGEPIDVWSAPLDTVRAWAENIMGDNAVLYKKVSLRDELDALGVCLEEYASPEAFGMAAVRALGEDEIDEDIAAALASLRAHPEALDKEVVQSDYLDMLSTRYTFEPFTVQQAITNAFGSLPGTNRVLLYASPDEALKDDLHDGERNMVLWYIVNEVLTQDEKFFYDNAPSSWNLATETREEGTVRCAREAAAAEQHAKEHGWVLTVEPDGTVFGQQGNTFDVLTRPAQFRGDKYDGYDVALKDAEGNTLASLGGVTFADNDPSDPDERRVLRATLAQEALDIMRIISADAPDTSVMFGTAVRQDNGLFRLIQQTATQLFTTKEEAERAITALHENNSREKLVQALGGTEVGVVKVPVWRNTGDPARTVFDADSVLDAEISRSVTVNTDDAAVRQKMRSPLPGM